MYFHVPPGDVCFFKSALHYTLFLLASCKDLNKPKGLLVLCFAKDKTCELFSCVGAYRKNEASGSGYVGLGFLGPLDEISDARKLTQALYIIE